MPEGGTAPLRNAPESLGGGGIPQVPHERPGPGTADMRSEPLPLPLYDDATQMRMALEAAAGEGTNSALILFIARNPDAPEADTARAMLRDRREPDAPEAYARGGPEADLLRAFDAARRSGDAAALEAFQTRHAGHPLAAEAARLRSGGG